MALVKPVIFQVVGYQNSGKTTVVSQLINQLKTEGMNIVTIKHHGHGGKPSVIENKDSSKHLDSGALASIVEGDGRLLLRAEKPNWTLKEEIDLLSFFKPDVILLEGFKGELFPKLLIVRKAEDLELLKEVRDIKIVITWDERLKLEVDSQIDIPCFQINDKRSIEWAIGYLKSQL
ncbi:molybdopterin-guanine dinucleotide biosynthesis protein B [Bacillus sp. EB600]|uniref:molybdopterin-guanine dinucleotide biosynthesis protein B n=1 Tax=Bacillus sp. EB600 TaxID=2806345 RepID=UPI00210D9A56|nr:molybdopterin-guanine dinucleotide biosynthesis protein B [Bacillus sp. EB600]MCQ6280979.1 molybdopterin-guanine dinucleotide biosynthesis protein B [Bacillus sp. EB600]